MLIILSLLFIVGIAIYLIYNLTRKKYTIFILQNSVCLKQINEINSRYNFYPDVDFNQSNTYDNENFYNTISCADYLIYQLQYIKNQVYDQIKKINSNKQLYSNYINEIKNITQFGNYQISFGNLKLNKLVQLEKQLVDKQTLPSPITQFTLKVTLYCSKINGEIYSRKSKIFSAEEISAFTRKLNNKRGTFYNDREIWDALCRVERGKVSNKMRFSIYARDGYKCRNCGISDRNAQLEIDHIIPIAKGGKTTYDNLQTLCHRCNVEKGDNLY